MPPETFDVEIAHTEMLAPSVKGFVFSRVDGHPFAHEPGQWVNLVLPTAAGEIRRAYSIASPPGKSPRFEIAVTEVAGGPGSGYLAGLDAGARLRAIGPQGFFTRTPSDPAPALFVGTGTGVTPLRSMMQAAASSEAKAPLWLLFGVRRAADLLYRSEFEALARSTPNVRVFFTLSQGAEEWTGRRGYVQTHIPDLLAELAREHEGEAHVYVCGLERMVSAVRQLVRKELGLPRERVHSERYD
ncbi:MAG TPA: FAD-dependent oxidoreductase [Polyangiaceae bacterium]|nr:FAD-dependent oxidoreductase [Polyangiaceae bacterium]